MTNINVITTRERLPLIQKRKKKKTSYLPNGLWNNIIIPYHHVTEIRKIGERKLQTEYQKNNNSFSVWYAKDLSHYSILKGKFIENQQCFLDLTDK